MKSSRRLLASITALGGLCLATLSLIHDVGVIYDVITGPSFCSIDGFFDCEKVASSPYSQLFGLPLSAFAVLFYLCFSALLLLHPGKTESQQKRLSDLSELFAAASLCATAVMFCVSTFLVGAYCLYCSGLYLISIVLGLICIRPPFNSQRLSKSLANACSSLVWFVSFGLIQHREGWNRSVARVGMIVLISAGLLMIQAPGLIVRHYYKPKSIDDIPDSAVGQIVKVWRNSPKFDLPIKPHSSGLERDFYLGPESAPITIVEFSDFECPHCRHASYMLKEVIEPYKNSVRLVFKNFPLDKSCNSLLKVDLHKSACTAALLARCAGEQDPEMFWAAHDAIFSESELNDEILSRIADELSADGGDQIKECLRSGRQLERVKEDISLGLDLKIRSTPTIYVNNRKLPFSDRITLEAVLRYLSEP